jgi:hypothetical protein
MTPLLPTDSHVELARELGRSRKPSAREWPDGAELVMTRDIDERELRPDPVYLAMNRLWTRTTDFLFGGFRKPA